MPLATAIAAHGEDKSETGGTVAARIELSLYRSLDAVEGIWREFELRSDCTVFQSFDWIASWLAHVGSHSPVQPLIILGKSHSGNLLFILPLAATAGPVRYLKWLGSELCDYNAPLLSPEFAEHVGDRFPDVWDQAVNLIIQAGVSLDVIHLVKMPERVGAQPHPFLQLRTKLNPNGAYVARLCGSWEQFYGARRSSKRQKADRHRLRRLAKLGEVHLVTPSEPNEIDAVLEKLFQQKSWSLAQIGAANVVANPGYRIFFRRLAKSSTGNFLHVSRLEVGNTWAATNVGLIFHRTYYHVLCSYERRALAPFGPGSAHLRELIKYAIDHGCERFDFTIGDEPYKLEWADEQIQLYDYVASVGVRGLPVVARLEISRRLARTIKQNRHLWQAYLRLRTAVAAWRARQLPHSAGRWSDNDTNQERRSDDRG